MSEIAPDGLNRRLQTAGLDSLVLDVRHLEDFEDWHVPDSTNVDVYNKLVDDPEAANDSLADIPDHPPNFERVKRVNVGQESVAETELVDLELGPNNCAAE
jgi:rhodanese-related sulfurtransferase